MGRETEMVERDERMLKGIFITKMINKFRDFEILGLFYKPFPSFSSHIIRKSW